MARWPLEIKYVSQSLYMALSSKSRSEHKCGETYYLILQCVVQCTVACCILYFAIYICCIAHQPSCILYSILCRLYTRYIACYRLYSVHKVYNIHQTWSFARELQSKLITWDPPSDCNLSSTEELLQANWCFQVKLNHRLAFVGGVTKMFV